jgi:hypothetical protein
MYSIDSSKMICESPSVSNVKRLFLKLSATSYMRPRAGDYYTSSIITGGKGGAGPSSFHTMLEGPME